MQNKAPAMPARQPGFAWSEPAAPAAPANTNPIPSPTPAPPAPAPMPAYAPEAGEPANARANNGALAAKAPPPEPTPAAPAPESTPTPAPATLPVSNGSSPDLAAAAAEYADLTQRKRDLERQLAFVKEELTRRESLLAEDLDQAGLQQLKTRAGAVIYRHEALFASLAKDPDGENAAALAALRDQGLGWMVKPTVNANTLRSWVKEQEQSPEGLPAELRPHLKISRLPRVGVRLS